MKHKSGLIEKKTFLESSATLIIGFTELASKRLVETVLRIGIIEIQSLPFSAKQVLESNHATSISAKSEDFFKTLLAHLDESYITVSYSWLETYLSIIEEVLYLNDPKSLGDNIQIKLGKILETESVTELIHDAVKKRLKEKSSWGLKNRINDLRDTYNLNIEIDDKTIEFISSTRNQLVHDKKFGDFTVVAGKISYAPRTSKPQSLDIKEYLDIILNLTVDLFLESSKKLEIDKRNKRYKSLNEVCNKIRNVFKNS